MPFKATFACLWCGTTHATRSADDLEGWAQLCPDCLGKAGDNEFLRFRLGYKHTERDKRDAFGDNSASARIVDELLLQATFILGAHPAHPF